DPPMAAAGSALAKWLETARKPDADEADVRRQAREVGEELNGSLSPRERVGVRADGEGRSVGARRVSEGLSQSSVAHTSGSQSQKEDQPPSPLTRPFRATSPEGRGGDASIELLTDPA